MGTMCQCERCKRVVARESGALWKKCVFVALFTTTLPYAWLLFVAGPGVVGVIPIVWALGWSIGAVFKDWAWPPQLCGHCGATLEWAPVVRRARNSPSRVAVA